MHDARCTVHGARCTVHGARCTMHGARCTVHDALCSVCASPLGLTASPLGLTACARTQHAQPSVQIKDATSWHASYLLLFPTWHAQPSVQRCYFVACTLPPISYVACTALGPKILKPTLAILVSTILIMLSIVNGGVDSEGKMATSWGWERHFGASFLTLCVRYMKLFLTAAWTRGAGQLGPAARGAQASLIFPAVGLFCYSWFTLLRQLHPPGSGPLG